MSLVTNFYDYIGGTTLKPSGAVTATSAFDAVEVGAGEFVAKIAVTAFTAPTLSAAGFLLGFESNTDAATSTWSDLGQYSVIATSGVFGTGNISVTGTYYVPISNPQNNQVRHFIKSFGGTDGATINGAGSSITYSVVLFSARQMRSTG